MKGAPFGNTGNANLRGRLSVRWADDILRNLRTKERVKIAGKECAMDTPPFQPSRNVDYDMPIEAVCRDGSILGAKVMGYDHDPCGPYRVLVDGVAGSVSGYSDGLTGLGLTIRNVTVPLRECNNNLGISADDIAKRMEALVRRIAETPTHLQGEWSREASAIVALLERSA